MILQTQVKNNVDATRNLRWAGVKGVSIAPGETIIIDGGYPTACRNNQCVKQLQAELDQELIEVSLVTDMKVKKIVEPKTVKEEIVETFVQEASSTDETAEPTKQVDDISEHLYMVETPAEVKKHIEEPQFNEGPMEDFFKKAFKEKDTIALDGDAGISPEDRPENAKQAIFKDAVSEATTIKGVDNDSVFEDGGTINKKATSEQAVLIEEAPAKPAAKKKSPAKKKAPAKKRAPRKKAAPKE